MCEQIADACSFSKLKTAKVGLGPLFKEGATGLYRKGNEGVDRGTGQHPLLLFCDLFVCLFLSICLLFFLFFFWGGGVCWFFVVFFLGGGEGEVGGGTRWGRGEWV